MGVRHLLRTGKEPNKVPKRMKGGPGGKWKATEKKKGRERGAKKKRKKSNRATAIWCVAGTSRVGWNRSGLACHKGPANPRAKR